MKSFIIKLSIGVLSLSLLLAAAVGYAAQKTIFPSSQPIHLTTIETDSQEVLEPTVNVYGGQGSASQCIKQVLIGTFKIIITKNNPLPLYIGSGFNSKKEEYTCGNVVVQGENPANTVNDTFAIIYDNQGNAVSSDPQQKTLKYNETE